MKKNESHKPLSLEELAEMLNSVLGMMKSGE